MDNFPVFSDEVANEIFSGMDEAFDLLLNSINCLENVFYKFIVSKRTF